MKNEIECGLNNFKVYVYARTHTHTTKTKQTAQN